MLVMSNYYDVNSLLIFGRRFRVQLTNPQNNISDFKPFLSTTHPSFSFDKGKCMKLIPLLIILGQIFINNEIKITGEPKSSALLTFQAVNSSLYLLKVPNYFYL